MNCIQGVYQSKKKGAGRAALFFVGFYAHEQGENE